MRCDRPHCANVRDGQSPEQVPSLRWQLQHCDACSTRFRPWLTTTGAGDGDNEAPIGNKCAKGRGKRAAQDASDTLTARDALEAASSEVAVPPDPFFQAISTKHEEGSLDGMLINNLSFFGGADLILSADAVPSALCATNALALPAAAFDLAWMQPVFQSLSAHLHEHTSLIPSLAQLLPKAADQEEEACAAMRAVQLEGQKLLAAARAQRQLVQFCGAVSVSACMDSCKSAVHKVEVRSCATSFGLSPDIKLDQGVVQVITGDGMTCRASTRAHPQVAAMVLTTMSLTNLATMVLVPLALASIRSIFAAMPQARSACLLI